MTTRSDGSRPLVPIDRDHCGAEYVAAHPEGTPWMWTVEFHQRQGRPGPHQGYTAELESAMTAFRESWDRGRS